MMRRSSHPFCVFIPGIILLLAIAGIAPAAAQPSGILEILSANELRGREVYGEQVQELIGKVHFIQRPTEGTPVRVWCDRALRYLRQNKVELFGNVKIVQDTVTLTSQEGTYYADDRHATVQTGVRMVQGTMTLTAGAGEYFANERRAKFWRDVVVTDEGTTTFCDRLTVHQKTNTYIAEVNVRVIDSANAITVFGDSLAHFRDILYSDVPKHPRLMQIDTTNDGRVDTLIVVSRRMEAFRAEGLRRLVATDSVLIAHPDLSARAGKTTYKLDDERIALEKDPVLWYGNNQITGDSIGVQLEDRELRFVFVKSRSVAVSKASDFYKRRFNQLSGRQMTLRFVDRALETIFVERNATSLYYLFDGIEPNGANLSSGDSIRILFVNKDLEEIRVYGGVQGKYFPEKMLEGKESSYNIDGFRWYPLRPLRKGTYVEYGIY